MTATAELREGKGPRPSLPATCYEISSIMSQTSNTKISINQHWAVLPRIQKLCDTLRYHGNINLFPKDL